MAMLQRHIAKNVNILNKKPKQEREMINELRKENKAMFIIKSVLTFKDFPISLLSHFRPNLFNKITSKKKFIFNLWNGVKF